MGNLINLFPFQGESIPSGTSTISHEGHESTSICASTIVNPSIYFSTTATPLYVFLTLAVMCETPNVFKPEIFNSQFVDNSASYPDVIFRFIEAEPERV
jgi:hypothetical protein